MGLCAVDLDEYVEKLNKDLPNSKQIPISNEFLDAVYNQLLELSDTTLTSEEVAVILRNVQLNMKDRVFIMGGCIIDLDEYVESLNDKRSSDNQLPVSYQFLDEVYDRISEFIDESWNIYTFDYDDEITPEKVDSIIENIINETAVTRRFYIPISLISLSEHIADLNLNRPSNKQLALSALFVDELFSKVQNSILNDTAFTINPVTEAVNILLHNVIEELASANEHISTTTAPKNSYWQKLKLYMLQRMNKLNKPKNN